jgi:hypothetical protein
MFSNASRIIFDSNNSTVFFLKMHSHGVAISLGVVNDLCEFLQCLLQIVSSQR